MNNKCLKFELKKFYEMKINIFFIFFIFIWSLVIAFSIFYAYATEGEINRNFIIIRTLTINGGFYIPIITILFIGRIYSIEYENNIQFMLKLYKNNHIESYVYKTLISLIYISISYSLQFFSAFIVEKTLSLGNMDFSFIVMSKKLIFEQNQAFNNIFILYINQVLGSIFILELFILYLNISKNYLRSVLMSIFSIFVIDVLEYLMFEFSSISNTVYKYLPLNSEYTWRSLKFLGFGDLAIGLILFSVILFLLNLIIINSNLKRSSYYEK